MDAHLAVNVREVVAGGSGRDAQARSYLLIGETAGCQCQHLDFTPSEPAFHPNLLEIDANQKLSLTYTTHLSDRITCNRKVQGSSPCPAANFEFGWKFDGHVVLAASQKIPPTHPDSQARNCTL